MLVYFLKKKAPEPYGTGAFGLGAWQCPTFAWGSTLSSAQGGFTSEVGMGSGGARPPWPPGNSSRGPGVRPGRLCSGGAPGVGPGGGTGCKVRVGVVWGSP